MGAGKSRRKALQHRQLRLEQLERRSLLAADLGCSPWQNPLTAADVNGDDSVSMVDAVLAVNALNGGVSGSLAGRTPPALRGRIEGGSLGYLDVSGDQSFSTVDALLIVNALNTPGGVRPAPEAPSAEDAQPGEIGEDVPQVALRHGRARVNSALNAEGDVDVYRLTAAEANLNIALFTRAEGAITVRVVNADGDEIGAAVSTDAEPRRPAAVDAEVEAGATYYVIVSGAEGVTGGYCLSVLNYDEAEFAGGGRPARPERPEDQERPEHLAPAEMFAHLDADASGALSLKEFSAAPAPPNAEWTPEEKYAELDADTNADLSLEEFLAGLPAPREKGPPEGSPDPDNAPPAGGPASGGPAAKPTPEDLLAELDADDDVSLSLAEFEEFKLPPHAPAHDEIFAAWDADASDSLSLDELAKGLAAGKRKN